MAKNLNQISLRAFTKMADSRKAVIQNATAAPLPPETAYSANQLAKQLHPDHQHFVISKIKDHGEGVKCFTFTPDPDSTTKEIAYFAAGQYLSVNLNIDGMPLTRAYSISSSPQMASDGEIELTIKQVPGGLVSNWVHENWKVGSKVDTSGPLGTFTYEGLRDAKTVIGIAGGSGITPFLSMARAIADGDEDFELILLYGSRTADSIVYKKEFDELEARTNKVKVIHVLSHEEKEGFEHGFINADLIQKYAPDSEYSVFLCGPQAMYDFVDQELEKLHLRRKFIRHELFGEMHGPKSQAEYPKDRTVPDTVTITVIKQGSKTTITGSTDDSLLQILEKNKIAAPSHCRSGECGWCHSRLVSGDVYMPSSVDGRREADKKFGYIHPCVSFPLTDIVMEIPAVR